MAHKIREQDLSAYRKLTPREGGKIYAQLRDEVVKAGILDRAYGYYFSRTLLTFALFFGSVAAFVVSSHPLVLCIVGIAIAYLAVQIGGFIHDAGHRAVFASSTWNDRFGLLCAAVIAFQYTKWRTTHNEHHAHPNQEGGDPDIELPFAFTEDHNQGKTGLVGFIRKYQVWLYYPLGSLSALFQRFNSLGSYRNNFSLSILPEILLYCVSMVMWYIVPFAVFPLWKATIFFVTTNFAAGLYMFNIFAPNHKGMPQIGKNIQFSFFEQQIITARNIHGYWLTDLTYMGLNYQIEHHLFPNCPRNKLRFLTPYIKKVCKKYGIEFTEVGVIDSHKIILSELKKISSTS